jgi:hypothetical protein
MLQDVIERFRYRFELWRRERLADLRGADGKPVSRPYLEKEDPLESLAPAEVRAVLTNSTSRFVIGLVVPYLSVLVILVVSLYLLGTFFPILHFACSIASVVLGVLWTLFCALGASEIYKKRKQYRADHEHI